MTKRLQGLVLVGAVVALAACGGDDGSSSDGLGRTEWTLTIVSPEPGGKVSTPATVRVAITGPAAVRGESPDFDIGYFVGDDLRQQTRSTEVQLELAKGSHLLRVAGVDAQGRILANVAGDEMLLEVDAPILQRPEDDRPGLPGGPDVRGNPSVGPGRPSMPGGSVRPPPVQFP